MGNAKRNGTYEQRKAAAIERERVKREALAVKIADEPQYSHYWTRPRKNGINSLKAAALIASLGVGVILVEK